MTKYCDCNKCRKRTFGDVCIKGDLDVCNERKL